MKKLITIIFLLIAVQVTGNYIALTWFWYMTCNANDWLSLKVTNITNSTDPTFRDFKMFIEKKPE